MTRVYSERLWGLYASLDQSLDPRGPDMLHEMACTYLTTDSLILDAGCRDAAHLIRLEDIYHHAEANLHWLVYQFLGKLQPTVYLLRTA